MSYSVPDLPDDKQLAPNHLEGSQDAELSGGPGGADQPDYVASEADPERLLCFDEVGCDCD